MQRLSCATEDVSPLTPPRVGRIRRSKEADDETSRFTEEQIIGISREQEARTKTADVCRWHYVSVGTLL
jgi:hypothetical protein